MKPLLQFFALAVWISSWFPTTNDTWAILASCFAVLGLVVALFAQKVSQERKWLSQVFFALGVSCPIAGLIMAFSDWAGGTHADGAITLVFATGWAAYLLMIGWVLAPESATKKGVGLGCAGLLALAAWSWGSALSMYFHRGVVSNVERACILVSEELRYETELSSIWKMRLPEVVYSKRVRARSRIVLNYHAVLVAPSDGQVMIYNWSKVWMRFEALSAERNPYIPTQCP